VKQALFSKGKRRGKSSGAGTDFLQGSLLLLRKKSREKSRAEKHCCVIV
jgi:hypothetical protein